jgi:hypothetical protein
MIIKKNVTSRHICNRRDFGFNRGVKDKSGRGVLQYAAGGNYLSQRRVRPKSLLLQKNNSQSGNGAVVIILFVAGIALAWFIINTVINWIYDSKEARIEQNAEQNAKKKKGKRGVDIITTTTSVPREVGGYVVEFNE